MAKLNAEQQNQAIWRLHADQWPKDIAIGTWNIADEQLDD